jgi:hypothetical protein
VLSKTPSSEDQDVLSAHEFRQVTKEGEIMKDAYGFDSQGLEAGSHGHLVATIDSGNPRTAIIRTSDRIAFKECRRRWGWSSHLRHNLGPAHGIGPLWFGTGIHFALEDFHGYNRFGHPREGWLAYYEARKKYDPKMMPDDHLELLDLGINMMNYYIIWLQQRKNTLLKTYFVDGVPQVEVNFRFPVPWERGKFGIDEVWYSGTIDRICIDEDGMLWPLDYKTAKVIQTLHYLTDPQVSAYMWASPHLYDRPIGGFLYQQHRKAVPNFGRILQNGSVSTAQNQSTTYLFYKRTLEEVYGTVDTSPDANRHFLNDLSRKETEWSDDYIRIDKVFRNDRRAEAEGTKILMEIEDMLNPDLPLYPNPTRECGSYCSFASPCVSMDDGSDYKEQLTQGFQPRDAKYDSWRKAVKWTNDEIPKLEGWVSPPEDEDDFETLAQDADAHGIETSHSND